MESILHLPQWDGAGVRAKLEQFRQRYRLQEKMELVIHTFLLKVPV